MQTEMQRWVIVAVILIIMTPVAVVLALQTPKITGEVSPVSFIPHASRDVLSINDGQNRLIIFSSSAGTGYIFRASPWYFYHIIQNHNLNTSNNISFSEATNFLGIPVYKLSNIQPISFFADPLLQHEIVDLNLTGKKIAIPGPSIFFSNPANNIFVLGNLSTVQTSLLQYEKNQYPQGLNKLTDSTAEIEFIIQSPAQEYIQQITGNLTGHTLSIFIQFSQSIYSADFFAIYLLSMLGKGVIIVPVSANTDLMLLDINNARFLPIYTILQSALGGL